MAEIQKPVELPNQEAAPATVVEPATTDAVAASAPAVEEQPTEEAKTAEDATEPKIEDKPVEEGHLSYKAQGASFPK